eukprot:GSChrysophyteH2.ASY1.ANO1.722.1 assembled CDS
MLRRLKEHVSLSLPSRKEITILVPLTDMQTALYKHILCGLDGEASVSNGGSADFSRMMNLLLQLRKICNHTYLMPDVAPNPYVLNEDIIYGSGKLLMLDRMLPRLREDKHRVLIFSQFTSMLDLLEDYCELRDLPFVRLDGDTNRVQRRLDCRRYNALGSNLFIFLISTRAGGLGLNLASSDTVILYDSDWNPQVDLQAMERSHRIGQTKPVRVFRLVCGGSVEERMINRAEKKLHLNAMVAEADKEKIDEFALGIGGATMSKSELASLIRFGANAVVSSNHETHISDPQLDFILERKGRDLDQGLIPGSASESNLAGLNADPAAALKAREENFKEVDLRQLGNTHYERGSFVRAIPMLTEGFNSSVAIKSDIKRGRAWEHQTWCSLCGKGKRSEVFVKCAHCPKVFHDYCMQDWGLERSASMYICPHHKCAVCTRSTANAGGLLFRCRGCVTSYCEDCLPQDEVESLGRCRELEALGYSSKQGYYIKCGTCCIADGIIASGVDGDVQARALAEKKKVAEASVATTNEQTIMDSGIDKVQGMQLDANASSEGRNQEVREGEQDEDQEDEIEILFTQNLRVHWEMLPDSEEERELASKAKREARRRKRKNASDKATQKVHGDVSGESEDDTHGEKMPRRRKRSSSDDKSDGETVNDLYFESLQIEEEVPIDQVIHILLNHPSLCTVQENCPSALEDNAAILATICDKLSSSKYRAENAFGRDIIYWLTKISESTTRAATGGGSGGRASKRAAKTSADDTPAVCTDMKRLMSSVQSFFSYRLQGLLTMSS